MTSSRAPSARIRSSLATADPGLLDHQAVEAQRLRRSIARGSTVVFVGIGYPAKRFVYELAASLDIRIVLVDHAGHWSESLVREGLAHRFFPIDVAAPLEDQAAETLAHLADLREEIDAVCTYWEETVSVAAQVADVLGLPGNDPSAVERARNKRLSRATSTALGLPTPRYAPLSAGQLPQAAERVGFPAIIKPELGSDASGCYRVDSYEELALAFDRIQPIIGPDLNTIFVQGTRLMLEEYLDGVEVDVDLVMFDGECVFANVTENWPTNEPLFVEAGLHCPSGLPPEQLDELVAFAARGARTLGLEMGVLHIEAKYTSAGSRILEVNARMGGGSVRAVNLAVRDVDLAEEHLLASLGIPVRPLAAPEPLCAAAGILLYPERSGTLGSVLDLERLAGDPRLIHVHSTVRQGDQVVAASDGFPTPLAEIVIRAADVPTAVARVHELAASISLPIT